MIGKSMSCPFCGGDCKTKTCINPENNKSKLMRLDYRVGNYDEIMFMFVDAQTNPIGTIALSFKNQKRESGYICRVYIDPNYRRFGIGTLLVIECCMIARGFGCETVSLMVHQDNDIAKMFYKKLGFIFAYQYDNDDVLMVKTLT